jgi:hypothetical protein
MFVCHDYTVYGDTGNHQRRGHNMVMATQEKEGVCFTVADSPTSRFGTG